MIVFLGHSVQVFLRDDDYCMVLCSLAGLCAARWSNNCATSAIVNNKPLFELTEVWLC